jgi:DNA-binding LytR/AlgR family response regulator
VRISSSELVNTRMITGMDFSLAGTIRLSLKGGITTYVSRRQVAKIRKLFDM